MLEPTTVAGVIVAVAQRYSVLLYANQTAVTNGTYWMRATLQTDMFTYDQPGQNVDIRGVFRCGSIRTGADLSLLTLPCRQVQ
jgi:hypothetical protein